MKLSEAFKATSGRAPEGYSQVFELHDDTRHVTVFKSGGSLLVAFDCTLGSVFSLKNAFFMSADWWKNFAAWPKALSVGSTKYMAMAGFVDEYLSLRARVLECVKSHNPSVIRVVGFSQGGAHATLCWRDLVHNFPYAQVHGVAFGSPRVYDMQAAAEFGATLTKEQKRSSFLRVSAWGDVVTTLPPALLGYGHVGNVKHIGKFKLFPDVSVHGGAPYLKAILDSE